MWLEFWNLWAKGNEEMDQIEAFKILWHVMKLLAKIRRGKVLEALCVALSEMVDLSGCRDRSDQIDVACAKEYDEFRKLRAEWFPSAR